MTFTGDRFEAMDLVSPCPKDVQCVWSGIVTRKGTFAISGSEATLIFAGEPDPRAVALPSALTLGPPLHEVGALSCEYSAR